MGENKAATKQRPPSHKFRVGTDAMRQGYRRQRAVTLSAGLARRAQLAAEIGDRAPVNLTREDGYAVCPPGAFDLVPPVIEAAMDIVGHVDLAQAIATAEHKQFMVRLANRSALGLDSPILRFALHRDVIATAARYLGVVPILQCADVFYSSHASREPAKSQLYHCDSDEAEQVKVFILCEEVTPATGPLTFLAADASQRVRDRVEYRYNTRLTDAQVRDAVGDTANEHALIGPAGTTAFIDTSRCLHYGSRFDDPNAHRVVVMLQYVTPLAFLFADEDYRLRAQFRRLGAPGQDELTTLVLGTA